jgi:hypothetical protein
LPCIAGRAEDRRCAGNAGEKYRFDPRPGRAYHPPSTVLISAELDMRIADALPGNGRMRQSAGDCFGDAAPDPVTCFD